MSSCKDIIRWPPFITGLLAQTASERAQSRSVKNGSPCKSYTADRAKISHPALASGRAERLFDDGGELVGVTLDGFLLLAFDHHAGERFSAGITQ